MTRSILIVGAGPAAAGAALACSRLPDVRITVIDVGTRLEAANEEARSRLAGAEVAEWSSDDLEAISRLPETSDVKGLPEKRAFGSSWPFRDVGQRSGLVAQDGVNNALVSGAYGGFSNVWGAQTMPFSKATLDRWPGGSAAMAKHYKAVLSEIPYAADHDDLENLFPLHADSDPLPPMSDRAYDVLGGYGRRRQVLRRHGITLGRARLAMGSTRCVRCGLCMTGCPWQLVYSASQTFDRLRAESRVNYRSGLLAVRVEEDDHGAVVIAQELESGRLERLTADRVFLACGAVGTTRLVAGSLRLFDQSIDVQESSQFTLPFVSRALMQDPRQRQDFTLNQFNMVLRLDDVGRDLSQIHFYTYNSAFLQALPAVVNRKGFGFVQSQLLRRLSVGIGYLPSWASPPFQLTVSRPADPNQLAPAQLTAGPQGFARNKMLRQVLLKVSAAAPALDLWPVLPAISFAASGKSYHVGATFPHRREPCGRLTSDVLGRVDPWRRIHLVDASVFPDVPATTFTLTIMANAHRIAHDSLAERA